MAIRRRYVDASEGAQCLPRVSRQRVRSRGAPLPSDGSRWPRFPAFDGNMKVLRLPTLHPSDLLFSPFSTMHACSVRAVARALPTPRRQGIIGPGFGFRAGCTPDRPSCTWTVPGLSGSLATHPVTLQRSSTPGGSCDASPVAASAVQPPWRLNTEAPSLYDFEAR